MLAISVVGKSFTRRRVFPIIISALDYQHLIIGRKTLWYWLFIRILSPYGFGYKQEKEGGYLTSLLSGILSRRGLKPIKLAHNVFSLCKAYHVIFSSSRMFSVPCVRFHNINEGKGKGKGRPTV